MNSLRDSASNNQQPLHPSRPSKPNNFSSLSSLNSPKDLLQIICLLKHRLNMEGSQAKCLLDNIQ
jgi:hypothetical protein